MKKGIFVKMYVESIDSGMVADMGAELWQTLCVLASYMDRDRKCFPTQDQVAKKLGIARETANRRIQRLLKYRWNGRPVIEAVTLRHPEKKTWVRNVYTIFPQSGFAIFDPIDDCITR